MEKEEKEQKTEEEKHQTCPDVSQGNQGEEMGTPVVARPPSLQMISER